MGLSLNLRRSQRHLIMQALHLFKWLAWCLIRIESQRPESRRPTMGFQPSIIFSFPRFLSLASLLC